MKRSFAVGAALLVGAVAVPAGLASASIIELGATKTALVAPTCPSNVSASQCTIILPHTTALETLRDGVAYPTTVKKAGRIVAVTVGLSSLSSDRATRLSEIKFLDHEFGGTTQVAVTVLQRVGPKRQREWKVVAASEIFHVQPYLGEVVQLPLSTTLPVTRGETVALTTPTWAPVLSIDLPASKFAYRQSRKTGCVPPNSSSAQLKVGDHARYLCDYPGTRVEYTATEITTPPYPKNYVHPRRRVHARRR